MKRCPGIFGELPLTGVLHSRDSEIRGTIARIAKANTTLKNTVNKLIPVENTYQDTNQKGTAREQKLKREAGITGELKRKYEY